MACMQAWSIFDDKAHIIKEAKGGGPMKHHGKGFMDFTQAVDQWMEDHLTEEEVKDLQKGVELMDLDT